MARVKAAGNQSTELRLLALFKARKIAGWRRRIPLPGKPDFVFPRLRLVVFVDGCFWHGCPLHGTQPAQNARYWREKIARNKARDRLVNRTLRALGWRVLRIWEHELKRTNRDRLVRRLGRLLVACAPKPR